MKLSVIIPVYDEEGTIREVIRRVSDTPFEKEIIVVDDGSTDGTRELLKEHFSLTCHSDTDPVLNTGEGEESQDSIHRAISHIMVLFHDKNKGKGAAIRRALKEVTGDIVIIQDADLEYDPEEFAKLIEPILSGETQVVYGSRNLKMDEKGRRKNSVSSFSFYWGGVFLSKLTNFLYGAGITDESTGYKVFRTEVIKNLDLKSEGFEFCPEVTAKLCNKGYRIKEVPISYHPRGFKEGKKIRWVDGFIAIFNLLKHRFLR